MICSLNLENSFVEKLPGQEDPSNLNTLGVAYSRVQPAPVADPEILCWSKDAAQLLELGTPSRKNSPEVEVFSGNMVCPNMKPYAARYGGHQFGSWAGQLGDGRAITLGEVLNKNNQRWEIQLKGAGPTPYSRRGDGRAVLRSSLREFVCSEAMYHLKVPTTRALCCVLTGDMIERDMFYDGNPAHEPGAITTRLAPSFIRFGNFQICTAHKELALLKSLANYVIDLHFPNFKNSREYDYLSWFQQVVYSMASLVVEWLRVGFVHGVMNTDNMSILGLTLDYGPYGWLDVYDPHWTPNTTDFGQRRYRFGAQPSIALWNLTRLGEALAPLLGETIQIQKTLEEFQTVFDTKLSEMMAHKLGLGHALGPEGRKLAGDLDQCLRSSEIDMTIFYRNLSKILDFSDSKNALDILAASFYTKSLPTTTEAKLLQWLKDYNRLIQGSGLSSQDRVTMMNKHNPVFIPRNYLVQQALEELATGNRSTLDDLLLALQTPYEDNPQTQKFFVKRPEWAREKPGSSTLSCSS
ncbi:MAG: YdiU family protein [Bdellovibrionaceae bacterium]|nr:YdiU family protein [Pseudobdellovibrionaceae bacterium]